MRIPMFPLSHGVFPDGLLRLNIFEVRYLDLIRRSHREGTPFGVPWLAEGHEVQVPGHVPKLHPVGCMAELLEVDEVQPALLAVACRGSQRFRLVSHEQGPYGLWYGDVESLPDDRPVDIPPELQPLADQLGRLIRGAQKAGRLDEMPLLAPYRLDECGWVANRWAELLPLPADLKADLLAVDDALERLQRLSGYLEPMS